LPLLIVETFPSNPDLDIDLTIYILQFIIFVHNLRVKEDFEYHHRVSGLHGMLVGGRRCIK
jgi:hypothetical protein